MVALIIVQDAQEEQMSSSITVGQGVTPFLWAHRANFRLNLFTQKKESEGGFQALLLFLPPTVLSFRAAYSTLLSITLRATKGSLRN